MMFFINHKDNNNHNQNIICGKHNKHIILENAIQKSKDLALHFISGN